MDTRPNHLLLVNADFRQPGYSNARRPTLLHELTEQLQQIPRARAVSFSELGLFSGGNSTATIEVEGFVSRRESDRQSALDRVGPRYFAALGIPMILGREILDRDSGTAPKVCVTNQAFAARFFAGRNPIGMKITSSGAGAERSVCQGNRHSRERSIQRLRGEVEPRYFLPLAEDLSAANYPVFEIRTATQGAPGLEVVRQAFRRVDASLSVDSAHSFEEQIAPLTAQDSTTAQLTVVFGVVALTLAAIGLYGVLSFGVASRTGEIAVRIALGAQPSRIIAMILGETSWLVVIGLGVGAGLAYSASRFIDSRLSGVTPEDPATLASATLLLLVVAFSAAFLPARRASRLDPSAALRRE